MISQSVGYMAGMGGLGEMSYEKAKEVVMWGKSGGFSQSEIEEARGIVYPGVTEGGRLVSVEQIESGQYVETEGGTYTSVVGENKQGVAKCGGSPVYQTPAMYPMVECHPRDTACVEANMLRHEANMAIKLNADRRHNIEVCKRNACLNQTDPRVCEGMFGSVRRVPTIPGENPQNVARDAQGIYRPVLSPQPVNQVSNTPRKGDSSGNSVVSDFVGVDVEKQQVSGGAGLDFSFLGDWATGAEEGGGGVPGWVVVAAAAAGVMVFMGRR